MQVIFLVRNNKFDIELIKHHQFPYYTLPTSGFFNKKFLQLILFFVNFIRALFIFPYLLIKIKPDAILASGSFSSLIPVLWANLLKIRYFLLEQNRIPGRFNKYFSRWAKEVYLGFPLVTKLKGNFIYTGNPLRTTITTAQVNHNRLNKAILVLGGSQGAQFLNLHAVELSAMLPDYQFIIQTGQKHYEQTKKLVKSNNCQLISFTPHPEELYQQANVVITRAGGMVLSEILFFGIPSIVIPYPFATDNHQAANAQFLSHNNAAIILNQPRQQGLSLEFLHQLKDTLLTLLNDSSRLKAMSQAALKIAPFNAAQTIAQRIKLCLPE